MWHNQPLHCGILLSNEKKQTVDTWGTVWVNLKIIMLNEVSQTGKSTYCVTPLIQNSRNCKSKVKEIIGSTECEGI